MLPKRPNAMRQSVMNPILTQRLLHTVAAHALFDVIPDIDSLETNARLEINLCS